MGETVDNDGVWWDRQGGVLKGFRLGWGNDSTDDHKPSPPLATTAGATVGRLKDLIVEAQISQAAFETELPTNPGVKGWYDNLTDTRQDEVYEAVKSFPVLA